MRRVVCGGSLLALLLVGCAEDERPRTLPPAPTPSATVSAAPSAAPVPTEAQAATPEGAAAFARYFYAEVERAFRVRDPQLVGQLSAVGCQACEAFVRSLTALRDNNERVEGAVYEIVFAEAPAPRNGQTTVTVIYNGPAVVRYAADGAVISREPAAEHMQEDLVLTRGPDSWLVQEVERP